MQGWVATRSTSLEGEIVRYQRRFPDGTDVLLSISRVAGEFVVTDSAESRTSGPVDVTRGRYADLADAEAAVETAAAEWEADASSG